MEYSSRKGIRIFLAALLSVSLLGTSGMQMFSEAFASEGDDAVEPTEQQMASSADNTDENDLTSLDAAEEPDASLWPRPTLPNRNSQITPAGV